MLSASITRLPARSIGAMLGRALYLMDVPHRRIVRRNLSFAYPELSADQRRRLAGRVFQNYGVNLLELFQMRFMGPEDVARRVRFYGLENLRETLRRKRGVILVTAHLGSWELGFQTMPCVLGLPFTAVAKKFKSHFVESWIHSVRTRFGNAILYKKDSLADMTRILRQGGILGIIVDMARRKDGVDVSFFGKEATATPAVAMLALRCRSAVLPGFGIRERDGAIGIHFEREIEMRRTKDLRADLVANTQRITDAIEGMVRCYPEQWFWLMRRWKDYYPQLYKRID
jgi:KDO2-lipid IV(A) lauroyltransferase